MEIILSNSSGEPLYSQIVTQIRYMILSGELHEGDALPSMRQLARDLQISLITTKRAYEELENAGLLVTMGGRGCYVGAATPDKLEQENRREMEKKLGEAITAARHGNIPLEELQQTAERLYRQADGKG